MDKTTIAKVQSLGFNVYMRNEKDSWLLFTSADDKNIGYLQQERFGGVTLSTVHIPNKTTGTGYQIQHMEDDFNVDDLNTCFATAPHWAFNRDRETVRKWRDMAAYIAANSWNGGYRKLEPVTA